MMSTDATTITINDAGTDRDFRITRMSGLDAEQWLIRAFLVVGKNTDLTKVGGDGASLVQALLSVSYEDAKGLLDDLLGCVKLVNGEQLISLRDTRAAALVKSPLTFLRLRVEAARLNFDFLAGGGASGFLSAFGMKPSAQGSKE